MRITVQQVSNLAGISVRTLHYYDEIGLLKPSFIEKNGYRYYEDRELLKLQQILFFRELEFSLFEIKKIMDSPGFDRIQALKDQKRLLAIKRKRIDGLIINIDKTITSTLTGKGGGGMNTDDLFTSFSDDELTKNMEEAKKRWGDTDAYRQSMERVKSWTKKDYERIKKEGQEFSQKLADAMEEDVKSPRVQQLIKMHHEGVEYFYDCPLDMYRSLGDMYVSDPRFTKYYDKFRPGLAKWLRDAINYYCDNQVKTG